MLISLPSQGNQIDATSINVYTCNLNKCVMSTENGIINMKKLGKFNKLSRIISLLSLVGGPGQVMNTLIRRKAEDLPDMGTTGKRSKNDLLPYIRLNLRKPRGTDT